MSLKTRLGFITFCSVTALFTIEVLLLTRFDRRHGSHLGDWIKVLNYAIVYINVYLCRELTERIFKGIIWSRTSQKFLTAAEKAVGFVKCGDEADGFAVSDRKTLRAVSLVFAIFCLPFVLIILVSPFQERDRDVRFYLLLGFTLGPAVLLTILWFAPAIVHVSSDTIYLTGKSTGGMRHERQVSWHQINSCEIITYYFRSVSPILIQPVFRDTSGKELLSLDLMDVKMADQERFVTYIKTRLPKSPSESWDL
jgi:hypothetical protein